MMALALFSLFAVCAFASVLVLTDSGLRAVGAWHRLRGELQMLSGECGSALAQAEAPLTGRVVKLAPRQVKPGRSGRGEVNRNGWRAAA